MSGSFSGAPRAPGPRQDAAVSEDATRSATASARSTFCSAMRTAWPLARTSRMRSASRSKDGRREPLGGLVHEEQAGLSSASGRWRASAARRPTGSRRAGAAARRAAGTARRPSPGPSRSAAGAGDAQVLHDGEASEDTPALRHEQRPGAPPGGRPAPEVGAAKRIEPARHDRRPQPADGPQQGRLAHAVAPEQRDDLALADVSVIPWRTRAVA